MKHDNPNKELNQAHDKKQQERVRPKVVEHSWKPLEDVIRQWVTNNK
jgi:hypothetical protein